ncbi:hypothetical protein VNO78_39646 [Psophocarpus tetragonolobus]|uniref:Uncharacterized protein n=1 Tax=Psophocarpus tetragonolobus TaxID=3891 RepID=A0AAN9RAN5_PSOTE
MNVSGTYTKWVMEYKTGRCTHAIGLEQHSSTILSRHTLCHELNFSTNRDTTITGGQHTPSQHNTAVVLHETFALSHFATFFIDARAEISVAESHFASCVVTTPAGHRLRVPKNRPLQFQFPWHTKRRGSPTETLLRLLLPLNDKVQWTSHNVAGSEPPTSPQSEHFTGPFNR